jgi:hypothetical protein
LSQVPRGPDMPPSVHRWGSVPLYELDDGTRCRLSCPTTREKLLRDGMPVFSACDAYSE